MGAKLLESHRHCLQPFICVLWDSPTREAEASGVFPSSSRQELASLGDGTWAEQVALDFSWLLPPNWLMVAQMVKHLPAMQETQVPSLGQEDPLEEGNGNPLQYSCLEDPMDSICLQCRRLRFHPWVRKIPWRRGMATHSSILAWRIPWTEEPGGLQSMVSKRHN